MSVRTGDSARLNDLLQFYSYLVSELRDAIRIGKMDLPPTKGSHAAPL